jgi:conjugative transposon TraM protein
MEKVQRSQAFLRKRKMMLVLPLLVIPFLTMAFWAMGGGKGAATQTKVPITHGLNLELPDAVLKDDKKLDKLSFYDQADKDSIKLAEMIRNDPYYHNQDSMQKEYSKQLDEITQNSAEKYKQVDVTRGLKTSPFDKSGSPEEDKIMQKLAELNKAINQPGAAVKDEVIESYQGSNENNNGGDIDRLKNMMKVMSDKGGSDDPEMKQLENTMDKILDIQHPERVADRIREKSLRNKNAVYPVSKISKEENISLLDTGKGMVAEASGFFGLETHSSSEIANNSIEAVIHENQVLVSGAVVKLRLLNDAYVNGSLIPKGNFVFGIASLDDERLKVEINSIRSGQSLYPVKLQVYDLDGLPGIYIPGAITRDVAKQSADNGLQLMELSTMDPSFKARAAAAGISAAKNLLSKKVKQVKVMVKAGYKVLLRDNNGEQ